MYGYNSCSFAAGHLIDSLTQSPSMNKGKSAQTFDLCLLLCIRHMKFLSMLGHGWSLPPMNSEYLFPNFFRILFCRSSFVLPCVTVSTSLSFSTKYPFLQQYAWHSWLQ